MTLTKIQGECVKMKFKTTKKEMNSNFDTIIAISYCNAEYLLKGHEPIAYSTRAEGWACDYYKINNILISTGYAPINAKNSEVNYEMLKRYDNRACEIACDWTLDYQEKCKRIEPILMEFIAEATMTEDQKTAKAVKARLDKEREMRGEDNE